MKFSSCTLDLGSGLLGGFGKDGLYSLMGHPLNAGLGSRVRLRGDGWGKMVIHKMSIISRLPLAKCSLIPPPFCLAAVSEFVRLNFRVFV